MANEIFNVISEHDSIRATALSIDYQTELNEILQFKENAVRVMANKMKQIFRPPTSGELQVTRIETPSPTFTAVKLMAALKHEIISNLAQPNFERDDSFLVTSSSRLQKGCGKQWMRNALLNEESHQQLLIVICDDDVNIQVIESTSLVHDENGEPKTIYLFSKEESESALKKKNVIVIEKNYSIQTLEHPILIKDETTYGQLSDYCKRLLLSKKVSFQNIDKTVKDLLGTTYGIDDIVDDATEFRLLFEEIVLKREKAVIPSFSNPRFEQSFYVERQMQFPSISNAQLAEELKKKCSVNPDGSIEWLVDDEEKTKIWEKMKKISMTNQKVNDALLIDNERKGRVTIICGEAGTGKSTVLSHFYEKIKQANPDYWVIRINLADYSAAEPAFEYVHSLLMHSPVVNDSPFARALLNHRFRMGGGVVVMLDDFDKIDSQRRKGAIQLMLSFADETYVNRLYVTTIPDFIDELQDNLFQFAYTLESFTEENEIDYLIKQLDLPKEETIAGKVPKFIKTSLNDAEKAFIPPIVHCRILTECFLRGTDIHSKRQEKLQAKSGEILKSLLDEKNFRLGNLYRYLMTTKREAFRRNQINYYLNSKLKQRIVDLEIKAKLRNTEFYLTRFAIETVFMQKEDVDLLWPIRPSMDSTAIVEEKEKANIENGLLFGLTFRNEKKIVEFFHKTYAEYLVAEFICKGFILDEKKRSKLLEGEDVRNLIENEILVKDQYKGVRIFLGSMLQEILQGKELQKLPEMLKTLFEKLIQHSSISAFEIKQNENSEGDETRKNSLLVSFDCDDEMERISPSVAPPLIGMRKPHDNDHGNRFQSKLLFLFFMRTMEKGHKFHLGTALDQFGGKFDDLIFLKDYGQLNQSFLYLQAKHKLYENITIKTTDLLNDNKGDFSLVKYFHSYRDDVMKAEGGPKPNDQVDCVICTNIDFDKKDLVNYGIVFASLSQDQLNDVPREMLTFKPIVRSVKEDERKKKYKKTNEQQQKYFQVADFLLQLATNPTFDASKRSNSIQQAICDTLKPNETIIDPVEENGKFIFHREFIDGHLSSEAKELRNAIDQKADEEEKKTKKNCKWKAWRFPMNPIDFGYKTTTCYRIKPIHWLDLHYVANVLRDCAFSTTQSTPSATSTRKKLDQQGDAFKRYHVALVEEKVIFPFAPNTKKTMKFSQDFIDGNQLTRGAEELRKIIEKRAKEDRIKWTEWTFEIYSIDSFYKDKTNGNDVSLDDNGTKKDIEEFFNHKLIFAVNAPNEEELDPIVKDEVGKKFDLVDADLESTYILSQMVNWFKSGKNWLSAEEGQKILDSVLKKTGDSFDSAALSYAYQQELNEALTFNGEAIEEMAEKLKPFLASFQAEKLQVLHITTPSPKLTAVKLLAALKHNIISKDQSVKLKFEREDSYLVTSSSRLQNGFEKKVMRNVLLSRRSPQHLLIVVNDSDVPFRVVDSGNRNRSNALFSPIESEILKRKKVIVIGEAINSYDKTLSLDNFISYEQLDEATKRKLLSKRVSFQGSESTVRDLIGDGQPEKILDLQSIEELLNQEAYVEIPLLSSCPFKRSLYIKRRLTRFPYPLDDKFWSAVSTEMGDSPENLASKFHVSSRGEIQWLIDELEERCKIWKNFTLIFEKNKSITQFFNEDDLVLQEERGLVIISGVAGTGKSTLLCQLYEEIKAHEPNSWVIRINLVDYFQYISKFDPTDKTAFDFFVDLPTVVGQSPFARSLLSHRLETGERISFLLDGFDEMDSLCREKVIWLMKTITKSARLYVTTRPHLANDLQFKLGQLAFTLEKTSQQDQVQYISTYWETHIESDVEKKGLIKSAAMLLIERLSTKQELSFISLQIAAECFLPHFQRLAKTLQQGSTTDPNDKLTVFLLKDTNFNLASLYRRLIQEKLEVIRNEQMKDLNSQFDPWRAVTFWGTMKYFLIQLAVKIVLNREDAMRLGTSTPSSLQSEAELEKEERMKGDWGVDLGLLYETRDELGQRKFTFMHRTYAEYFVADYLYEGFHLDEDQHNHMLDDESIRRFILTEIFLENEKYEGIQIFFNDMFGEIVDENDEWRDRISQRKLPDRFRRFSEDLLRELVVPPKKNALHFSVKCRKGKIFKFLCDCLDATFERRQVQQALKTALVDCPDLISLKTFCEPNEHASASAEVFFTFLSYIDTSIIKQTFDVQSEEIDAREEVMEKLLDFDVPEYGSFDYWDGSEQRKIIGCFLQFLKNNREFFNRLLIKHSPDLGNIRHLLRIFIFNVNYHDGPLQNFLKLLSESNTYSNDDVFANLIANSCAKEIWIKDRIDKTLIALRDDLKRHNVIALLLHLVLEMEPEAHQRFSTSHQKQKERTVSTSINADNDWIQKLLERDHLQMTRLHREAFQNKKENVKEILDTVAQILMETDAARKNLAQQVVDLMARDDKGFTPLHVAISGNHQEICHIMLNFLKRVLIEEQLKKDLTSPRGFLYQALWNAIQKQNVSSVELILNSVKRELGQDYLIHLLKSDGRDYSPYHKSLSYIPIFASYDSEKLFHCLVKIVVSTVDKDRTNGYEDLSSLMFHDKHTIGFMRHVDVDTLQRMLSVNGVDGFTRRLIDADVNKGFHQLLAKKLLEKLDGDQLVQMLNTITDEAQSYWKRFKLEYDDIELVSEFFKYILTRQNIDAISWVKRLVLIEQSTKSIVLLQTLVNATLASSLPHKLLDEVIQFAKTNAPDMIKGTFFPSSRSKLRLHQLATYIPSSTFELSLSSDSGMGSDTESMAADSDSEDNQRLFSQEFCLQTDHLPIILQCYLDYGDDAQLKKFAKVVTTGRYNIWARLLRKRLCEEMIDILKRVSGKKEICDAVETLLLFKIDKIPVVSTFALQGMDVGAKVLIHLPKENQDEVQKSLHQSVPKLIDKAFLKPKKFFNEAKYYRRLNLLRFFLDYATENQVKDFVKNMTTVPGTSAETWKKCTIWGEITVDCKSNEEDVETMKKFMQCVLNKCGQEAVRDLVLHDYGEGAAILHPMRRGEGEMVGAMIECLDTEEQRNVSIEIRDKLDVIVQIYLQHFERAQGGS